MSVNFIISPVARALGVEWELPSPQQHPLLLKAVLRALVNLLFVILSLKVAYALHCFIQFLRQD